MKQLLTLFFFIIAWDSSASAQVRYDTVRTMSVAPGMVYTHYTTGSVPWVMDVLQIDLKNPYLRLESVKAQDRYAGLERTSAMAARSTSPGRRVIGAINADFFDMSNGRPINMQVAKGEIVRGPISLSTIGFTEANRVVMDRIGLKGIVRNGAMQTAVNDVNSTRNTDQLILYNGFQGASTGTNQWGTEVAIRPLTRWIVNDTVVGIVESVVSGAGNMAIARGSAVLSGHGAAEAFLKASMHVNDTVRLVMTVSPGEARITELLGGYPRIVRDGADYVDKGYAEEGGPEHTYQRHNRTAIGFSADSSKLFLVTIDGRTAASLGMTLKEVSAFMRAIGVHQGMNFDGGGSTTMVINNSVVNVVTDGSGERPVANALLAVTTAPIDTLVKAELTTKKLRIFRGEVFTFSATGWDSYGNIVPLDAANGSFSVAPSLGSVTKAGVFTAGVRPDSGWVYFLWKTYRIDSAYVVVKGVARLALSPKNIATDSIRSVQYRVVAYDADNTAHTMAAENYAWKTTDPAIAVVGPSGVLKGKRSGTTRVVASCGAAADTAAVTIEIGTGTVVLDGLDELASWRVSGLNIDTAATRLSPSHDAAAGRNGFTVEYAFTYTGSTQTFVFLEKDIPVYGSPDTLFIDLRSDSVAHRVSVLVTDDNGEQFRYFTNRLSQKIPEYDRLAINATIPSVVSSGTMFNYPICLKRIEVQLGSARVMGTRYTGTFHLDNFRVRYPSQPPTGVGGRPTPAAFELRQNYPNPFNPTTTIVFSLAGADRVSVVVFDVLGKEVAALVNATMQAGVHVVKWNAKDRPSGMYFYQVRTGAGVQTKRMLLLK